MTRTAAELLAHRTLCGHDEGQSKISDVSGRAVLCGPCARRFWAASSAYLGGGSSASRFFSVARDVAGTREAWSALWRIFLARHLTQPLARLFHRASKEAA
jgi:hypothetical protein